MALLFTGGDSDNVNFGSDTSLDNLTAYTGMIWIYLVATGTPNRMIMAKGTFPSRNPNFLFASGAATLFISVDRATADASASTTTTVSTGVWSFVAFTYDESDGPRIFKGDLSTLVTEASYDGAPTVGSGATVDTSAADLLVGGLGGSNSINGRIATFAYFNRRMTLAEIQSHQFRPRVANGCVLFSHLGFNGTGTQPDWSGSGNSGSVTGATVADHVPLGPPFGFDIGQSYAAVILAAGQADIVISSLAGFRRLNRPGAGAAAIVTSSLSGMTKTWNAAAQASIVTSSLAGMRRLNRPGAAQAAINIQTFAGATGGAAAITLEELFRYRRFRDAGVFRRRNLKGVY